MGSFVLLSTHVLLAGHKRAVVGRRFLCSEIRHLTVDNRGWELVPIGGEAVSEELQIRGYKLVKHDQVKFTYSAPGHYVIDDTVSA